MKKILIVFFTSLTFIGCFNEDKKEVIRPVEIFQVTKNERDMVLTYPGITIPSKETNLAFKIPGPILKINVEIGSFVKKGDIIASMDKRDYLLNLKAFENKSIATKNFYEASLAIAKNSESQFQRVEKLYKNKALPKKIYEEALAKKKSTSSSSLAALANYQASKQAVENCKNHILDADLIAPFTGYITKKFIGEGGVAAPGVPVFSIASIDKSKIRINMSEKDLSDLDRLKSSTFIYKSTSYPISLETASKIKSFGNISYPLTFKIKDEAISLPSDVDGTVKLYLEKKDSFGTIIPIESVFEKNNTTNVWLYKDGIVILKEIKLIQPLNNNLILVSGLNQKDKIVTKGVHQLSNNEKVKVLKTFSKTNVGKVL